jgi:hypothetical protein
VTSGGGYSPGGRAFGALVSALSEPEVHEGAEG